MISPGIEHTYTNKPFRIWQGIDKDTQIEIPSIRKLKNEPNPAYPLSKKMVYNILRNTIHNIHNILNKRKTNKINEN